MILLYLICTSGIINWKGTGEPIASTIAAIMVRMNFRRSRLWWWRSRDYVPDFFGRSKNR